MCVCACERAGTHVCDLYKNKVVSSYFAQDTQNFIDDPDY